METNLKAEHRDGTGKGAARKLRATGRVPGILYGAGVEPTLIHVAGQDLLHLFHGAGGTSVLVDLVVDGATHLVLPREVQRDHIRGRYIHVDFLAVNRNEKVTLLVEVHETGDAPGVKTGGVIEHHLRDVEIECLPGDVPEGLSIDISRLEIGDLLRVADIVVADGITILTDPDTPVISVITPAALRTEADIVEAAEAAAAAEAGEEEGVGEEGEEGDATSSGASNEEGGEG